MTAESKSLQEELDSDAHLQEVEAIGHGLRELCRNAGALRERATDCLGMGYRIPTATMESLDSILQRVNAARSSRVATLVDAWLAENSE